MAPGTFNGHNFGGLHTGTGKYQTGGPYAHNGYRHKNVSHKEYKEGLDVLYLGNHKNVHYVPTGYSGKVIKKRAKGIPRTMIYVDFNKYGRRYVYKKNLYIVGSFERYMKSNLAKTDAPKVETSKRAKMKKSEKRLQLIKKSREKRSMYRLERRKFNDSKELELELFIEKLKSKYGPFPINYLLEKKSFMGKDNEYSRDYSAYMKLKSKVMVTKS